MNTKDTKGEHKEFVFPCVLSSWSSCSSCLWWQPRLRRGTLRSKRWHPILEMKDSSSNPRGRQCYHCKEWIAEGEPHDCWTTTEAALTAGLSEDLREAWERLRETAAEFGEQRIYASHKSIMFARKVCYFFVRPKKGALEVVFFLGRLLKAPQVRRTDRTSTTKVAHTIRISHRDEVEAPITDWLREAYEWSETTPRKSRAKSSKKGAAAPRKRGTATKARARPRTS